MDVRKYVVICAYFSSMKLAEHWRGCLSLLDGVGNIAEGFDVPYQILSPIERFTHRFRVFPSETVRTLYALPGAITL